MVIYSVTIKIRKDVADEWMKWMKDEHIPNMLKTGYFDNYSIFKVLIPEPEENFVVYKTNYELNSFEKYRDYSQKEAARLQAETSKRYHGKLTGAREVIEIL